ncbi:MAG: S41 family peptidase [Mogibacterium sp.]|nr:S41 family peptidase [Mogibacterium sp.]
MKDYGEQNDIRENIDDYTFDAEAVNKDISEIKDVSADNDVSAIKDVNAIEDMSSDKEFAPKTKKRIFFVLGFLCCLSIMGIIYVAQGFIKFVPESKYEYYKELEKNYGKYNEILRMIGDDPIATTQSGEIDDAKLKELVAGIGDPYAQYFTAEEYKEFEKAYSGEYVGIGIGVLDEDGKIVIKTVMEGGPAEDAGMQVGDIITNVDGSKPKDSGEAVSMITGESGTSVTVKVDRAGEEIEFKMNRTKIEQDSVSYEELEDAEGIGYIEIRSFIKDTAKDFKHAVKDLKNTGCDRFIIDLRNNGGGLTAESIEIADYLLPACKIMTEKTKDGKETVYNSKSSSANLDFVMLTSENTASASEILAGAIQDNKAGLIIGEKTYGKGVTQMTKKFKDGTAVKITITEYFRPSGKTVNGEGIAPDIDVAAADAVDAAIEELGR